MWIDKNLNNLTNQPATMHPKMIHWQHLAMLMHGVSEYIPLFELTLVGLNWRNH